MYMTLINYTNTFPAQGKLCETSQVAQSKTWLWSSYISPVIQLTLCFCICWIEWGSFGKKKFSFCHEKYNSPFIADHPTSAFDLLRNSISLLRPKHFRKARLIVGTNSKPFSLMLFDLSDQNVSRNGVSDNLYYLISTLKCSFGQELV